MTRFAGFHSVWRIGTGSLRVVCRGYIGIYRDSVGASYRRIRNPKTGESNGKGYIRVL